MFFCSLECSHCPERDKRRTLSEVLLAVKPREEILAFGYEAHKTHMISSPQKRKTFVYQQDFTKIFEQVAQI